MYQSPIEVIYNDVKCRFEEGVYKAIQNVNINVNREELIKALLYDRDQYDKGYYDGLTAKSEAEPAHEKPVVYYHGENTFSYVCGICHMPIDGKDFYCRWCGARIDKVEDPHKED